ncbi:YbaB/EbfC family nucleoid-associated protein [Candidatus Parcubacteria bacterium]|nr:YbaB/EbfC family nucleoid-associated protein [Patescibacteria group bacterium]MCG2694189.1 YbaB/EbfC family nucleoid-associated protein [Candidatus Parcubacteria bacterium]
MFDKLKGLKNMQEQAKKMQSELSSQRTTTSEGGVVLTLDGNMELFDIRINESLLTPEKKNNLETLIKIAHRKATKQAQKQMAKKMRESGGLGNLGIPGI